MIPSIPKIHPIIYIMKEVVHTGERDRERERRKDGGTVDGGMVCVLVCVRRESN